MGNPILMPLNAGTGTTPLCPEAKFSAGDVVKVRRLKHLKHLPEIAAIAVVVPPGFPPDWAMADATGRPRPLMHTVPSRHVTYIIGFDGDPTPHLFREQYLLPSGEPKVPVRWDESAAPAPL